MTINKLGINRLWNSGSGGVPPDPEAQTLDFIGYGQSNWLRHVSDFAPPSTPNTDTLLWDNALSDWVAPTGNGLITFLNAVNNATGKTCRFVSAGDSGAGLTDLNKGTANYTALITAATNAQIDPVCVLWMQGEAEGNTPSPSLSFYRSTLDILHQDIVSDLGTTKESCPLIVGGLAIVDGGTFLAPETSWQRIKNALATLNELYPNLYYSHSNTDAELNTGDPVHWTPASYGRSGARYAQTYLVIRGDEANNPKYFISSSEILSATTTKVNITHSIGADFTPTTGITGFEVSEDNGGTWISASGVRLDADSITLTHASLVLTGRLVRYQYGKLPDTSGAVKDNSSLSIPLNYTVDDVLAPGAVTTPFPVFCGVFTEAANVSTEISGIRLPSSAGGLLVALGIQNISPSNPTACSVTCLPSGTVISATLVVVSSGRPACAIYQAVVPSGTVAINVSTTYLSLTQPTITSAWAIPTNQLTSTTAVDSAQNRLSTGTAIDTTLETLDGGCVIAVSNNRSPLGGALFTGDESYVERFEDIVGAVRAGADTTSTAANLSSQITATFEASSEMSIVAASWR